MRGHQNVFKTVASAILAGVLSLYPIASSQETIRLQDGQMTLGDAINTIDVEVQELEPLQLDRVASPNANSCFAEAEFRDEIDGRSLLGGALVAVETPRTYYLLGVKYDEETKNLEIHESRQILETGDYAPAFIRDTLQPSYSVNLEKGAEGVASLEDIWWAWETATQPKLKGKNGTKVYQCDQAFKPDVTLKPGDRLPFDLPINSYKIDLGFCTINPLDWRQNLLAETALDEPVALRMGNYIAILRSDGLSYSDNLGRIERFGGYYDDTMGGRLRTDGSFEYGAEDLFQFGNGILTQVQDQDSVTGDTRRINSTQSLTVNFRNTPDASLSSTGLQQYRRSDGTVGTRYARGDFRWVFDPRGTSGFATTSADAELAPCVSPLFVKQPIKVSSVPYDPWPAQSRPISTQAGALGTVCRSNSECNTGYCADNKRCAPRDGTGKPGQYCHNNNHCQFGECLCPNGRTDIFGFCPGFDRLSDDELILARQGGTFSCSRQAPSGPFTKACLDDNICSAGNVCWLGYCQKGCRSPDTCSPNSTCHRGQCVPIGPDGKISSDLPEGASPIRGNDPYLRD